MSEVVLDASAVLCYLQQEPGYQKIELFIGLRKAYISSVNLSEVIAKLVENGTKIELAILAVTKLDLKVVVFDEFLGIETARLRPVTKGLGLSLADRCCIALAKHLRLPLFTTDKAWRSVKAGVKINVLR